MSTTAQTSRPATTYEQRDRITIIRLDGGRRGTPLNRETLEGLRSGVTRVIADSGVDGAVITGTGTDFCFGADFRELRPLLFRYSPWWLARRAAAAWFGTPHPSEGAIREVVTAWPQLSPEVREAIVKLARSGQISGRGLEAG